MDKENKFVAEFVFGSKKEFAYEDEYYHIRFVKYTISQEIMGIQRVFQEKEQNFLRCGTGQTVDMIVLPGKKAAIDITGVMVHIREEKEACVLSYPEGTIYRAEITQIESGVRNWLKLDVIAMALSTAYTPNTYAKSDAVHDFLEGREMTDCIVDYLNKELFRSSYCEFSIPDDMLEAFLVYQEHPLVRSLWAQRLLDSSVGEQIVRVINWCRTYEEIFNKLKDLPDSHALKRYRDLYAAVSHADMVSCLFITNGGPGLRYRVSTKDVKKRIMNAYWKPIGYFVPNSPYRLDKLVEVRFRNRVLWHR